MARTNFTVYSTAGPLKASVVGHASVISHGGNPTAHLTIAIGDRESVIDIFRTGPDAVEQILDLGYEIITACRKLMPAPNEADESAVTHDFRPSAVIDRDLAERL